MSSKILDDKFFSRPTLKVAEKLLGKFLVRKISRRKIADMITEVEVYTGPEDKASHASRGRTERNKIMFGKAGYWYVYFTYGMHWMLNIVTEKEGYPAAILIRGVGGVKGPGRLTNFFKIDKGFNNKLADRKTGLWIEDRGIKIKPRQIKRGKRIGVGYAGRWENKLWRFFLI